MKSMIFQKTEKECAEGRIGMSQKSSVSEYSSEVQDETPAVQPKERPVPHKGEGHRGRLREKFLESGLTGFHDYEVIEMLLTLATPRKDCKDTAKEAMSRFKTLQGVLEAAPASLLDVTGIGPQNIFGIKLIQAVADRYLEKRLSQKDILSHSKALFDYLYYNMRDKSRECFKMVHLDAKNQVLGVETLFVGSLSTTAVYPREVVQSALDHHAAAVIFAHNHPSGDPTPSSDDMAITRKLIFCCDIMGITVHEHIVIGENRYFSFADEGHISSIYRELASYNI
jgi:DNA repair protein RadC